MAVTIRSRWVVRNLQKRSGSDFWYFNIRDKRTGIVYRETTETKNKKRADQFAQHFIEEKEEAEKHHVKAGFRFDTSYKEWLSLKTLRPSTRASCDYDYSGTYLPAFGQKLLSVITREDIKKFLKNLEEKDQLSARSRKKHLTALRSFFREMILDRKCSEDPTLGLKVPKGEKRKGIALDQEQAGKLLEATRTAEIRSVKDASGKKWDQRSQSRGWLFTACMLGLHAGLRRGNIVRLTWGQVDLEKRKITIPGKEMKAHEDHEIPIHPELAEVLDKLYHQRTKADPAELVIGEAVTGKTSALETACERAGIPRIWFHCLRHTVCTAWDSRFPRGISRKLMGHAPGNVTDIYSNPPFEKLLEAVDQMPWILVPAPVAKKAGKMKATKEKLA